MPAEAPPALTYYAATADRSPPRPPLSGRVDAEVCIVGAGFAGLATALGLIERGVRDVLLLEAEHVGFGASGRNGGFVFGGYSLDCADLLDQQGPERARAMYGLTQDSLHLIRRRIATHGINCDKVEGGALLANWFDDDALLRRQQALMAEHFDADWQWVDRDEMAQHVRTRRYTAGLLEPGGFHFHPLKYAQGLARAIEAGGGRVFEGSPVRSLQALPAATAPGRGAATTQGDQRGPDTPAGTRIGSSGYRIRTAAGEVHARHLVVTAGGYLRQLLPALERAMLPIATYVMATEPLGERLREFIPGQAAVYDTRFAFDYYRPLPDTRILWGGRISILQRSPEAIRRLLTADLLKVYPGLAGTRIDFAWGGLMSYARHKMPQIGRLPDGTWHALGFGGHGVAPTTVAGELLADALVGGKPVPPGFGDYGLPRVWGPAGQLAAQATYSWAELRDWWRDR